MKKVIIKVKDKKGFCSANHNIGDNWEIKDNIFVPEGLCMHAFYVLYPWIQVLRMEGKIPWSTDNEIEVPCIDSENLVIFSLKGEEIEK
ncbi:MAG: TIGR04076 family protein [Caldisericia bacterium]|nr:TIGR04076 family protein [Caldisericia bacterium]